MNSSKLALVPLVGILVIGCTTTRSPASQGVFSFDHDGDSYQIVSIITDEGDGHNFLLRRDDGRTILRARDDDQDGSLDIVLRGEMNLEHADAIYAAGIALARDLGRCEERAPQRVYERAVEGVVYSIRTYVVQPGEATNRFLVFDAHLGHERMFVDTGATGRLDEASNGAAVTEAIQDRYEAMLREGVRKGFIEYTDGRYLVRPRRTS